MPVELRRFTPATLSAKSLGSFLTLGWVGANVVRTFFFVPALLGRSRRGSRFIGFAALAGFVAGIALLVVLALAGVEDVPKWATIPPTIVTVQGVYGLLMGAIVPSAYEPSVDLTSGELAFTLYGVILYPPTALLVLVMTADALLS